MARLARSEMVVETEVGAYHCIQKTVRSALLCGVDPASGKNRDHRREWLRARLEYLAAQFGIDVLSFAIMSNHYHVILRNRPDVVQNWSDDEVVRRWWYLYPKRRDGAGAPAKPSGSDLLPLASDRKKLSECRAKLSSISWFTRCLAESIARRANKEDQCTGHFWEGRFKCRRLLDNTAILACSAYVDLSPVRAGWAKTPRSSEYTSVYERLHSGQERVVPAEPVPHDAEPASSQRKAKRRRPTLVRDEWLSPVERNQRQERRKAPTRRASHLGFLPMKAKQYFQLLDWTARQLRHGKRGAIPEDIAPVLEAAQISDETWVDLVENFDRWFRRAAGRPENLAQEASRRGQAWMHGTSHSRALNE